MKLTIYRAKVGGCPRGQIFRKAFTRKPFTRGDGIRVKGGRVPGKCIEDRGKAGKGPKTLPTPVLGALGGWKKDMSDRSRHEILKRLTRKDTCATVIRRLVLLRNISADPATDRVAKADQTWLRKQPFCKLKSKENR